MTTQRLRPRSFLVDAELARTTVVELPSDDAMTPIRSLAELLRSFVPFTPRTTDRDSTLPFASDDRPFRD